MATECRAFGDNSATEFREISQIVPGIPQNLPRKNSGSNSYSRVGLLHLQIASNGQRLEFKTNRCLFNSTVDESVVERNKLSSDHFDRFLSCDAANQ